MTSPSETKKTGLSERDGAFLDWIADRLINVHGDDPNVDFVLRLRELAGRGRNNLTPRQADLAKRLLAQAADSDGWRDYPDDLTRYDSVIMNRWFKARWIDLEETPVYRITEAGRAALQGETK